MKDILTRMAEARRYSTPHQRRGFLAGKEAAEILTAGLNGGSREDVLMGCLEGLAHSHRHLQIEAIWTIIQALSYLGAAPLNARTDARNASAISACEDRTAIQ